MLPFPVPPNLSTQELLNLPKSVFLGTTAVLTALALTGCNQIPSLNPNDKAANTAACESVSTAWETLNTAFSSGDILGLPAAVVGVPQQLDQVLSGATDQQLRESLTGLKVQVQSIVEGNQPDVSGLVASGVGITARCAILGATVDLQLPQIP